MKLRTGLLACAVLVAFSVLGLSGCPLPPGEGEPDVPVENPVYPTVQDVIVMVAGGATQASLDLSYRGTPPTAVTSQLPFQYVVKPSESRYGIVSAENHAAVAAAFAFSINTAARSVAKPFSAEMAISAASNTASGIYRFEVKAVFDNHRNAPTEPVNFAIVVLPTGDVVSTPRITSLAAGAKHTLALTSNGELYAWGANGRGQLGDGTLVDRSAPVRVVGLPDRATNPIVGIAAGGEVSSAWLRDGTIWMWGDSAYHQIGIYRSTATLPADLKCVPEVAVDERYCYSHPVQIGTNSSVAAGGDPAVARAIPALGWYHGLLVRSDGVVLASGDNSYGQRNTRAGLFGNVEGLPANAVQVAAQGRASLALMSDGNVWGWGLAEGLALGVPVPGGVQRTPIDIPFLSQVTALAAGDSFALALRSDRTLRAWGSNSSGQLGFGDRASLNVANHTVMATLTDPFLAVRIAAGRAHSLALSTDGGLYAWGENNFGQVGNSNAPDDRLSPTLVLSLAGVTAIAAGGDHSAATVGTCGQVAAWGANDVGQLGHSDAGIARDRPLLAYGLGEVGASSGCEMMLRVFPEGLGSIAFTGGTTVIASCAEPASHCAAKIGAGGMLTVIATPASNANFARWLGDCGGTNPSVTITMNHSKNCIAVFRAMTPLPPSPPPVTANLSVNIVGQGSVTSSVAGLADGIACPSNCAESYVAGSIVTLTASPNLGSVFSAWTGTGCAASAASVTVTMDVARTCAATFISNMTGAWTAQGTALNVTAPTIAAFVATPEVEIGSDGQPVAAFVEGSGATTALVVRRWDNTANVWTTLGTPLGTQVTASSLTIDSGGAPVVAWHELDVAATNGGHNVFAARWNGTVWVTLGGAPVDLVSAADSHSPSIRARSGDLVLAWVEATDQGGSRIVVHRWDGAVWSNVGTTQGPAQPPTLPESALPKLAVGANDQLAVAWSENFLRPQVAELIGGVWTTTSTEPLPNITSGADFMLDLAYSTADGLLFVAQQNNGGTFSVRRWRAGGWSDMGTPRGDSGIAGGVGIFGIAFSHARNGATPLLAYSRRNRASSVHEFIVERFVGADWGRVGSPIPTLDRHRRPGFEFNVAVADAAVPRLATQVRSSVPGSSSTDHSIVVYRFQ